MRNDVFLALIFGAIGLSIVAGGPFDWMERDAFDEIIDKMDAVNPYNCRMLPASALRMDRSVVTQHPRFNELRTFSLYRNRSMLLHMHNMALGRAFYYSYMNYKANETWNWDQQPGMMYYYMGLSADVSANPGFINGSSYYAEYNLTFANFYHNLPLNNTLLLFGPHSYRLDDYNDPSNWLREPTNNTMEVVDIGTGYEGNYTNKEYKINEWYDLFLPDFTEDGDSFKKFTYTYAIKYSNATGTFVDNEFKPKTFFGPPSPGVKENFYLPVKFTAPYYDCGKSNRWIVSAVAPVVDHLSRYHIFDHIRRPRFSAVVTMDANFLDIDFNPCPLGQGNPGENFLAGTARCKEDTTMCQPLHGFGFRRGGYECVCRPGFRLPYFQRGPFLGVDIEAATEEEYNNGFDCLPVGDRFVVPQIVLTGTTKAPPPATNPPTTTVPSTTTEKTTPNMTTNTTGKRKKRETKNMPRLYNELTKEAERITRQQRKRRSVKPRYGPLLSEAASKKHKIVSRRKRAIVISNPMYKPTTTGALAFDQNAHDRMTELLAKYRNVTRSNCKSLSEPDRWLAGDAAYGVEYYFEPQGRVALRLAHFLSNFLQNANDKEDFADLKGDQKLHVDQVFGEVASNVLGNIWIYGSGVFFDQNMFENRNGSRRSLFGAYAWRTVENFNNPLGIDFAGAKDNYLNKQWFREHLLRWRANSYGLTRYTMNPWIRSDVNGSGLQYYEKYPIYSYAPSYEDGIWFGPYFECDGYIGEWILTYSVPFFGLSNVQGIDSIEKRIEFKGVVTVDVRLADLDINQCPEEFYIPNAFKGTARCHFESTYCVPTFGHGFTLGGYKCECKQGYEYTFIDDGWFFDGKYMEAEWEKKQQGTFSRFDTLQCRISGSSTVASNGLLLAILSIGFLLLRH